MIDITILIIFAIIITIIMIVIGVVHHNQNEKSGGRPSLKRYTEIKLNDTMGKVIEVLGDEYTRDLLSNGTVRLTWKKVYGGSSIGIRGSGVRVYNPQTTQKVVVKFKDNKVIEVKANNL